MSGTDENNSAGADSAEEEAISSTSTWPDRNNELQAIVPVAATGDIIKIIQQRTDCRVNVNLNVVTAEIHGQNIQVGDQCTMPLPGTTESDKLKKLLEKSLLEIEEWKKKDGLVFVETPAFQESQMKLKRNGCVTLLGQSGDGKTSVGFRLLDKSSRQVVIVRKPCDWDEIDVKKDQIIMIDDIMGRHVFDKNAKVEWVKNLRSINSSVKSGKVQIVITSRGTVFSLCKEELQAYDLFHSNNIVHLSGPESQSNLDIVTKIEILRKYINSNFAKPKIYICETENQTVGGVERKISKSMLKTIAEKETVLGFPQCCRVFVSTRACFDRGHHFFDNPTEFLIQEINRMQMSHNNIDQFNYCTLVCVLLYEELKDDTIEKQLETIKVIAESCGINTSSATLQAKIRLAAARLSTSYLVKTRDSGYTFQHNSLLQTIFTSFFKSQPKLLIEHCAFNLLQSLVTTEQATEKSDLFCEIQSGTQTDCLCSRLTTEIMASNIKRAVGHRALTDPVFVSKFFSHINTSSNKKTVLKCIQSNESILYYAAGLSDKCFVEMLLTEMKSVMFVNKKARMGKKISKALCEACHYGNYDVFTLLVSRPGVKVFDKCLCEAASGGDDRIVTELLSVKKWSTHHVTEALYEACSKGIYDMYRSLIAYDVMAIDYKCLCEAARGKDDRIVTELLSAKKWSTYHVKQALYWACFWGKYDMYRSLITYDVTAIGDDCLCEAASGGDDRIVTDLLSVKKWSTRSVTQALCMACSDGRHDMYISLITYDVTAIDDECLWKAASGRDNRIVTDLLSVKKWTTRRVTCALYEACRKGSYDIYRSLITHDVTAIDYKCLCEAASGGDVGIFTELLSFKKWSTHDVTQALYKACSKGRYDVYRSLITHDVTAIDDRCLWWAALGGHDRIVTELLSVKKWYTRDVTQALYKACSKGGYDMYRSLITYDVTAIDDTCLLWAASGGHCRIVTELLSVKKWSTRHVTQALYEACGNGRYDVYRTLITYDVTAIGDKCLCKAAIGEDDRIVTDLLSVKKWSTRHVTQALYWACRWGRYDMYRSLITYDVTAIDDTCLWKAARGGQDRIVTNLLSVMKWSTHDATQALFQACSCGRYDVYRLLITYDVTAIDDKCLCEATSGGHDRIVTGLLSVKKWSTHHVTEALYKACGYGRYDVYRSLIKYDVTAIDGECLCEAARHGGDHIVTDLLSVKKWSTPDVTQALYTACVKGRYDVYRSLITYDVTAIDDGCLRAAVIGGNTKIKDDLLSKGYKLPY